MINLTSHSSINISRSKEIWVDPFKLDKNYNNADILLITHPHYDHMSPEDINRVVKTGTVIVSPKGGYEQAAYFMSPGETLEFDSVTIEAVAAYNKIKPFHIKSKGWLGYLITLDGIRYYVCGDTDLTDEAKKVQCDVLLVPCGGTYTMNAEEAAKLANIIKPGTAVPTHYGSVVGSPKDGQKFKKLLEPGIKCDLQI